MTLRLFTLDSSSLSKVIVHKILWGWTVLTMIPLLYLFIYSFKISHKWIKLKLMVAYSILMAVQLTVIVHYGFLPRGNNFNSYASLIQTMIRFVYYAFIFYVLFHDAIKLMEKSMTTKKVILLVVIFLVASIYMVALLIFGFIEKTNHLHHDDF